MNIKSLKILLVLLLCLEILSAWQLKDTHGIMAIVPNPPSKQEIVLHSLGDNEFYFRILSFILHNAGDQFGRLTPLKLYDYKKLQEWFVVLDELDNKSDIIPALASYYYGQTPNTHDLKYVIDYLEQHAQHNPKQKWWWLYQATYIANYKLGDKALALKIANQLSTINSSNMPLWTKQMPAFIMEQMGEKQQAIIVIENIINNVENLSQGELNFMHHFIKERLSINKNQLS